MTKSASLEYAKRGICINAVCPGTIDTPMRAGMIAKDPDAVDEMMKGQPNGRMGRPGGSGIGRRLALRFGRAMCRRQCTGC
jgi:NAD(P)-dependent dehydrogenase (short-subunit alcohol dehydrogenase family)